MNERTELQKKIGEICPDIPITYDEPMAKHTSFRIGGPAEVMAFPRSNRELTALLEAARLLHCKPRILGAGTNVLAPDGGIPGLVICLKDGLDGCEQLDDTHIGVAAGVTMTRAAMFAARQGLSGLEFAHGIPGTVGGGIYMNAGAYDGEIGNVLSSADILDSSGSIRRVTREELDFSYRHSRVATENWIVLRGVFSLTPSEPEKIQSRMTELLKKRAASQPLDLPSAGSAFKRPVGGYAAALIDEAGLKGFRVGNAAISSKHAGFAVNLGGASATDVTQLLQQVSDTVYARSGIRLEPEIRVWE